MRAVVSNVAWSATLAMVCAFPASLRAQAPIQLLRFDGTIQASTHGVTPFSLKGETPELGKFTSVGEVALVPGVKAGSLVGHGVVVIKTSAGDVLVGVTQWDVAPVVGEHRAVNMQFSWRDSVRLSNGNTVSSTGRFVHDRPGDMTAHGIIAILIGLLVPAP